MQYLAFLLGLWLWTSSLACEHLEDYTPIAERTEKALLYKLSGCGAQTSYLLGTFHSDSPKLDGLLAFIEPYLGQTDRLMLEVVATPESQRKVIRYLQLPPESENLNMLIGGKLFNQVVEKFARPLNMNRDTMQRFQPWALAVLVQYPPAEGDGIVLDAKLQRLAARKAIPAQALESLDEQFTIFTEMPFEMQVDFLESTLADIDELNPTLAKLESHYMAQDVRAIYALSDELFGSMAEQYPELAQRLETELIDKRNLRMARRIAERLDKSLFIGVGALHLPGEMGMLTLLERTGLQIEPIPMP